MALSDVFLFAGAFLLTALAFFLGRKPNMLPPGPKGWPVIGNIFDMPTKSNWLTYAEWGRKYGPICSVNLMGQRMIIVNDAKILAELDRKGAIYSDRPRLEMAGELVGYAKTVVLLRYNTSFRNCRKHISKMMGTINSIQKYLPMEEHETRRLLKRVLANPGNLNESLRKTSGSIILKVTYGIDVQEENDPFVKLIESSNTNFGIATTPGTFLVDNFPALRHLPENWPGAGFKRLAKKWAEIFDNVIEVPYAFTKGQMDAGIAPPSFLSSALADEEGLSPSKLLDIKHTAASLYGAGADTTVSAQYAFFLAMILYPYVQKKAQAEIDAVVGSDRLPGFMDRENLPYINAIVSEVLRWNSVAPIGFPHTAMEDGIVGGYFVPKGSIIITNLWQILHDAEVYPDPFTFDPSRFIAFPGKEVQRDPRHACFGYGRRYCAGSHLAEASLFICFAMSLAVFDITNAVENGVSVVPVYESMSGIVSHPKPFKYCIKPRSERASALVLADNF
ncbi:cytochrome P450 [Guyanagaster necrorhizus]|uniref:Cytochrome P450 n=1 Tax=Guyanagaster necrorhizus TaxID=856835 RepID=A0A9P8ATG7_9AGAR|nr:cytochrome P450 [Guyanagaster necrorhizus MCA 3950]KAG7446976.1 cytochrome P450 [Guyanagaster necrorhizus MCA 3950]